MKKSKDLTGKTFGQFKVIKRVKHRKRLMWLCVCSCGTERFKSTAELLNSKVKSCINCASSFRPPTGSIEDLSGKKFNYLEVLSYKGRDKNNIPLWRCKCFCGNSITVTVNKLKLKNNSCGCIRKQKALDKLKSQEEKLQSKREKYDLTGKTYNYFTVIKKVEGKKNNMLLWLCRCKCGTEKIVPGTMLKRGQIKSCGCIRKDNGKARQIKINTGDKFDKLTIIEEIKPVKVKSRKYRQFKCLCDCGKTTIKKLKDLTRRPDRQKSCGCHNIVDIVDTHIKGWYVIKKEKDKYLCKCNKCGGGSIFSRHNLINRYKLSCACNNIKKKHVPRYEGTVVNNVVVLYNTTKNKYKVECIHCGKTKTTTMSRLKSHRCICKLNKIEIKTAINNSKKYLKWQKEDEQMVGKKFGRLTVISKCMQRYKNKNKGRQIYFFCKCSCGGHKIISYHNLKSKNNRSCGCLRFEVSYQGRFNFGSTGKYDKYRRTKRYKLWRTIVLNRDKHTCQICNKHKTSMIVHHLLSFSRYKKYRYNINNGITLCKECHDEFHNKYTSTHFTIENFIEFKNMKMDIL